MMRRSDTKNGFEGVKSMGLIVSKYFQIRVERKVFDSEGQNAEFTALAEQLKRE